MINNKIQYDLNQDDYSVKTSPDYNRHATINSIFDRLNNTNWEAETKYFNYYYTNGKVNYGRTLKKK